MNQEELERLVNKSDRQLFINDLNTGYGTGENYRLLKISKQSHGSRD